MIKMLDMGDPIHEIGSEFAITRERTNAILWKAIHAIQMEGVDGADPADGEPGPFEEWLRRHPSATQSEIEGMFPMVKFPSEEDASF